MKIRINDLPEDRVCLKLNCGFRKKLFTACRNLYGSYGKLNQQLSILLKRKLWKDSALWWSKDKNPVPLETVKKLIEIYNSTSPRPITQSELENGIIAISIKRNKVGGSGKYLYHPKFPIELNPKLANLLGHLIGDGSEKSNNCFTYANKRKELIDEVIDDVKSVFGEIQLNITQESRKRVKKDENKVHVLSYKIYIVRIPTIIWFIIKKFCKSFGLKSAIIPTSIWKNDKNVKGSFIRALFDDEGSVYVKEKKIKIKLANKKLIQQIKKLLRQLSIESGKIQKDGENYLINICRFRDLKTFSKLIGFTHIKKANRLNDLLNSYKYLAWTKKMT